MMRFQDILQLILTGGLLAACLFTMAESSTDSLRSLGMDDPEIVDWLETQASSTEDKAKQFRYYFQLSELYTDLDQWQPALEAVTDCIKLGEELSLVDSPMYRDAVTDKGACLLELRRVHAAESWIRSHIGNVVDDWRYVKMCMLYAGVLESMGDLALAGDYLDKALDVSRAIGDDRYASRCLVRQSLLYLSAADRQGLRRIYREFDSYAFLTDPRYAMSVRYNLSAGFLETGEFRKAIELAESVIEYGRTNAVDAYVMWGLLTRGYALRELGQYEASMTDLRRVADYGEINLYAYNNMAEVFLMQRQPDSAVHYSELALRSAGFDPDQPITTLTEQALRYPNKVDFMVMVDDLARGWLDRSKLRGDTAAAERALDLYALIDTVADELRLTTAEEGSQHFWRSEVKPIFDNAIRAGLAAGRGDRAFYFAEKSKAVLLLDDMVKHRTVSAHIVPDSLLDAEFRLKQEIVDIGLSLFELDAGEPRNVELQDDLLAAKRKLNDLAALIARSAPRYVSTRYRLEVAELDDWEGLYSGNEAAVNFIWSKDGIYRFAVRDGRTTITTIPIDSAMTARLESVLHNIGRPISSRTGIDALNDGLRQLYEVLFEGISPGYDRLTVFPDGPLHFLPFEALITGGLPGPPEFLVQSAVVQYGFSVNTTYGQGSNTPGTGALAFAPNTYESGLDLQPLRYFDQEMEGLLNRRDAFVLKDEAATRPMLLESMDRPALIHLYSHAAANDTTQPFPWIAGRHERIFLPEIYNHRTRAELVILSACETNLGKQVSGEGVISLARGFFHAGAGSVMASLWSVNDRSNSEIVRNFYHFLSRKKTMAESLRLAKLQFMEDHPLEGSIPYHWAGLVYIGPDGPSPLDHGGSRKWPLTIGIILIVLAGAVLWKRYT